MKTVYHMPYTEKNALILALSYYISGAMYFFRKRYSQTRKIIFISKVKTEIIDATYLRLRPLIGNVVEWFGAPSIVPIIMCLKLAKSTLLRPCERHLRQVFMLNCTYLVSRNVLLC